MKLTPALEKYLSRVMQQWTENKLTVNEKSLFFSDVMTSGFHKTFTKQQLEKMREEMTFIRNLQ